MKFLIFMVQLSFLQRYRKAILWSASKGRVVGSEVSLKLEGATEFKFP